MRLLLRLALFLPPKSIVTGRLGKDGGLLMLPWLPLELVWRGGCVVRV